MIFKKKNPIEVIHQEFNQEINRAIKNGTINLNDGLFAGTLILSLIGHLKQSSLKNITFIEKRFSISNDEAMRVINLATQRTYNKYLH